MSEESTASHASSAKITRPHYARVLPRDRLFRLLDDRRHPVIWVNAPPGAGKTALVSSYLKARRAPHLWYQIDRGDGDLPTFFHYLGRAVANATPHDPRSLPHLRAEYIPGVAAFVRHYFEGLAARTKPPFIIVFDNYHEVPPDAELHAVLRDGLAALPPGFVTIVMSRGDPPAEWARMRVNDQLLLLGWDELRLTLDEVKGIERLMRAQGAAVTSHRNLYDKTQGWAGGLVCLLQGDMLNQPDGALKGATHQVLFDYFAGEIFANLAAETQRVLAATALLSKMAVRAAVELVDYPAAGELLQNLNQRNYFTLRHDSIEPVYEYHPLFREFLLARAAQLFEPAELTRLRRKAATLLEADGQVEEAMELLDAAGDSEALARLIGAHAPAFIIEQGRHKVVDKWLARLPEDTLTANPWLVYWRGVARLPFNTTHARACFEAAYATFKASGDLLGRCRAWCAIVDSLVFEWSDFKPLDHWIDEMSELLSAKPQLRDAALEAHVACGMFLALMYRRPGYDDLPHWEERVRHIILFGGDSQLQSKVGNHLIIYYAWWIGDLAKAELLVNTLRAQMEESLCPLNRITWHAMATAYYLNVAAAKECVSCVDRGLGIADESGIHTWDMLLCAQGVYASMSSNDADRATAYLRRMEGRLSASGPMDKSMYYYAFARLRAMQGDLMATREMAGIAVAMAENAGACLPAAAMRNHFGTILARTGQADAGAALIDQSRSEGVAMQSSFVEYLTAIAAATVAMDAGDETGCLEHLRRGLALGAQSRLHKHPWWSSATMARLYGRALAHGIEIEYVTAVIRKRDLAPPDDGESLENWPWTLKIYTLGGFRILKNGEPLRFTGKSPRKPLELLRALIAFGGAEVNQSSLIDALWPELEGDNAQRAFETALYRLRKLLGDDAALVLKSGKLTLETSRVWVDSLGIERLFQEIDSLAAAAQVETPVADRLVTRLLAAYSGHFLPEEAGAWAISRRERLCNRLLSSLQEVALRLESRGAWAAAARCYRRALETEPLRENLWYRLMICHKQQGETAEALAVYRRCRQTLSTGLGVKPSTEIETLRKALADPDGATPVPSSVAILRPRKAMRP